MHLCILIVFSLIARAHTIIDLVACILLGKPKHFEDIEWVPLYDWDTWKTVFKEELVAIPLVIVTVIVVFLAPQSTRGIIVLILLALVLAIIVFGIARDFRRQHKVHSLETATNSSSQIMSALACP